VAERGEWAFGTAVRRPEATRAANQLLQSATGSVALNQRRPPEGFDPMAFKLEVIRALQAMR